MSIPAITLTGFVLPVGNGAVGKTSVSLVLDWVSRHEAINQEVLNRVHKTNNLEFEYITTRQAFNDTQYTITMQFLIPPGQKESEGDPTGRSFEKVVEIYRSSLRRVDVVLFTYNLANHDSFHDLTYWVDSVGMLMNDASHFILLGTHLDQSNAVEVSKEEIQEGLEYLRKQILQIRPAWAGRCTKLEVSCMTGENIDVLLRYLAASIVTTRPV